MGRMGDEGGEGGSGEGIREHDELLAGMSYRGAAARTLDVNGFISCLHYGLSQLLRSRAATATSEQVGEQRQQMGEACSVGGVGGVGGVGRVVWGVWVRLLPP